MTEAERKRRIWVLIRALRIIWAGLSISKDIHEFMAAIEVYAHESSKIIQENSEPLEATVSKAHRIIKDYDHAMLGKAAIDYFKGQPEPDPAKAPRPRRGRGPKLELSTGNEEDKKRDRPTANDWEAQIDESW